MAEPSDEGSSYYQVLASRKCDELYLIYLEAVPRAV